MELKNKGFTLLEMIVVLFLVSLITGLSILSFANFLPSVKFNAAGREMVAMIRHARALARINMESQTFIIDLDNRTFGIAGLAEKHMPPDSLIKVISPLSGEIVQGKYSFVFHPASTIGGGTIVLSMRKKILRIDIDPLTGALTSMEGH